MVSGWYWYVAGANHLYGFVGSKPRSCMAKRMRRWTGLSPSLTSGSALPTITDIAYCEKHITRCSNFRATHDVQLEAAWIDKGVTPRLPSWTC